MRQHVYFSLKRRKIVISCNRIIVKIVERFSNMIRQNFVMKFATLKPDYENTFCTNFDLSFLENGVSRDKILFLLFDWFLRVELVSVLLYRRFADTSYTYVVFNFAVSCNGTVLSTAFASSFVLLGMASGARMGFVERGYKTCSLV